MTKPLIVVIGDVHHHIGLAAEGLSCIEDEFGRPVAQVFSVGDFGLFLHEEDWEFLTGPKKYRTPEASPRIRAAWQAWRWPLSMIGGNHEPFHLLRDWTPGAFGGKLEYTDAGELKHGIPGLRVVGLSGIYHPGELEFISPESRRIASSPHPGTWPDMVRLARDGVISRKRLCYYKQHEIDHLCSLAPRPDLLLLHDWPETPGHIQQVYPRRPEREILDALVPNFLCCGHHHTFRMFRVGETRASALNIITSGEMVHQHKILPGWAAVFEWDGRALHFLRSWSQAIS